MKTKLNNKAFTFVEILVALSILGVVGVAVAGAITDVMKIQLQISVSNTALRIEDQIKGNLVNGAAWANTIAAPNNTNLICLRSPQDLRDCQGQGGDIILYDAAGQLVIDPVTQGFSLDGEVCNDVGQNNCLFKTSVRWKAVCPSTGICSDPQIDFNVVIDYLGTAGRKVNYNKTNHSFNLTQAGEVNSLVRSCESVGGTFDTTTKQCILSGLVGDCPPSYVVVQVTPGMNRVCRPVFVGACTPSKYMVAINSDGTPVCKDRPLCPPPPPPPPPPGDSSGDTKDEPTSGDATPGDTNGDTTPGDSDGGPPPGGDSDGGPPPGDSDGGPPPGGDSDGGPPPGGDSDGGPPPGGDSDGGPSPGGDGGMPGGDSDYYGDGDGGGDGDAGGGDCGGGGGADCGAG